MLKRICPIFIVTIAQLNGKITGSAAASRVRSSRLSPWAPPAKECSNVASPLPLCIERDTAAIVSTQSHAFHLSEEAADTSISAERKRGSSGIFKGRAAHAKCNSEALSDYSHVGPGLKICGGTAKLRVSSGECSTVRTLCRFCYLVSV